jgi:tetratricopeptide (TPR) repeat protein
MLQATRGDAAALLLENNGSVAPVKEDMKKPALELPSIEIHSELQEDSASEPITHKLSVEESSEIISPVQDCQEIIPKHATDIDVEKVDGYAKATPTDLVLANASIVETSSFPHDCYEDASSTDSQGELTVSDPVPQVVQALADPVSARLAAVHHLSQAIKSLRWQRQLQDVGEKKVSAENVGPKLNRHPDRYTECVCGEPECVAICDFRDIEVGLEMDEKLWQLLLLLGESYLTLAQAYKEDGQFSRALKAAELACLARGSTPRPEKQIEAIDGSDGADITDSSRAGKTSEVHKDKGYFWGQVWLLVGDIFSEVQRSMGDSDAIKHQDVTPGEELKMAQEVMKEVKRLKKKVGQFQGNCEICSLTSCSCQSDRASSGISASSSHSFSPEGTSGKYARKHVKKSNSKNPPPASDILIQERDKLSLNADVNEAIINSDAKVMKREPVLRESISEESTNVDIFTYLGKPVVDDWEKNLSAASECYSSAVNAFADSIHLRDYENALRKKGWACNELGRRRLAQGHVKSAETAFETAIVAFRAVKDLPNIVLVFLNLAHGRRAAAEVFASQLSSWEGCQLPHFYYSFIKTLGEARFLYQEALEFYGEGRKELMAWGDGVERTMRGLCNEVYTQLAHTYLKLGMLLAREDKFLKANRKNKESRTVGGNELDSDRKSGISAKEAISKALVLYESLGSLRAQEAAYAQFQLGCQQRDSCLFAMAVQAEETNTQKRDTRLQGAKRLASMADRYWQKALEYYKAVSHPDMFLQIMMERSAMCLAMAPLSHPNSVSALSKINVAGLYFDGRFACS